MAAIGQIVELEGNVQVLTADGVVKQVRVGDWLEEGDQIVTGAGSRIQVRYIDGNSQTYGLPDTETADQVPTRNDFSEEYAQVINALDEGLLTTDELLLVAVAGIAGVDTREVDVFSNSSEPENNNSQGSAFEREDVNSEVDTQGTNVFQRSGENAQADTQNSSIFERSADEGDVDTRPTSTFESSIASASVDTRNVNTKGNVQEDDVTDDASGVDTRATGADVPVTQDNVPDQFTRESTPTLIPLQSAKISLIGPASVIEGQTTGNYTLAIDNAVPAGNSVTVNLSYNGIAVDGTDFNGIVSVDITGSNTSSTFALGTLDDVYAEGIESLIVTIDSVIDNDGSYDAVSAHGTDNQVTTTITDDSDSTTLSLDATASVSESGTVTYSATLTNPANGPVVVSLSNGESITITDGATSGAVDVIVGDDVYLGGGNLSTTITGTSGGGFENLIIDGSSADSLITDDSDTTTATLSVDQTTIDEDGATLRYTVTLDNATDTAMTLSLSNGEGITIGAGDTTGFVDVVIAADSDVFAEAYTSIDVSIASTSGGNFESLDTSTNGSVSTTVSHSADTVTVSLSATASTSEDGGSITYTATLSGGDVSDHDGVSVTLNNGETIAIAAGATSGTTTVAVNLDDVFAETDSISNFITGVTETTSGQFEDLDVDNTPDSDCLDLRRRWFDYLYRHAYRWRCL